MKAANPSIWTAQAAVSLRLRLRCAFAVVLLLCAMVGGAAHRHSDDGLTPHTQGHAVSAANSDVCPLCVAMHSAAPAVVHGIVATATVVTELPAAEEQTAVAQQWHLSFYSRPPPAPRSI